MGTQPKSGWIQVRGILGACEETRRESCDLNFLETTEPSLGCTSSPSQVQRTGVRLLQVVHTARYYLLACLYGFFIFLFYFIFLPWAVCLPLRLNLEERFGETVMGLCCFVLFCFVLFCFKAPLSQVHMAN